MGILDSVKNFVTGGGAEMSITLENPVIEANESLKASISAMAKEDTMAVRQVYVSIKAEEKSGETRQLYETTIELEKNVQLSVGELKSWNCEVPIPADVPATFFGRHSSLQWYIKGGLDVSGVDPNTGWQKFVVNRLMVYHND